MHLVASVRPFVMLSCLNRLIFIKFEAKKTITSLRCLSVSVNLRAFVAYFADAVDWLLIHIWVIQCQMADRAHSALLRVSD